MGSWGDGSAEHSTAQPHRLFQQCIIIEAAPAVCNTVDDDLEREQGQTVRWEWGPECDNPVPAAPVPAITGCLLDT